MSRSPRLHRQVGCCAVLLLIGSASCEGTLDPDSDPSTSLALNNTNLKNFAKKFRITANGPLLIETRSGQTLKLSLTDLEIELAPSSAVATRARTPALDATFPASPSRAPVPASFQADVPCAGTATRARVPVPTITIPPDVPDGNLPTRVRVPVMDVTPIDPGMTVIATRVRVPAGQMQLPPPSPNVPAPGNGVAAMNKTAGVVTIPAITIGLLPAADPAAARTIILPIPPRSTDTATFAPIHVGK